jgi:type I restriction enzyme S subunit
LICSTGFAVLTPNQELFCPKFLFYICRSEKFIDAICASSKGVSYPAIDSSDLKSFFVWIPTIPEQTAIAKYLDEKTAQLDKLIEGKRRLIALLKEERSGVINNAVTRGINPQAKFKPSGIDWLGEIPEHWEVKRLKRVTEKITNGFVGATVGILKQDGIGYIQSLHIKDNTIKFSFPYYVSEEWSNNHSRSILKEKDILVVQTGAGTGNIGIVPKEFEGCNCHALIIIRIAQSISDSDFIMNALTSDYGKHLTKSIETGALHPHLNSTKICDIELLVPPIEEQKQIVQFIEAETSKIDATAAKIEKEIEYLLEYRTALISEVVTGKIKVV